jgi:hypothetical protein
MKRISMKTLRLKIQNGRVWLHDEDTFYLGSIMCLKDGKPTPLGFKISIPKGKTKPTNAQWKNLWLTINDVLIQDNATVI